MSFLTVELIICLDGIWGIWSSWETCSASCGGGTQQRTRDCDSPAPTYGGAACAGSTSDNQNCSTQACPIGNYHDPYTVNYKEYGSASLRKTALQREKNVEHFVDYQQNKFFCMPFERIKYHNSTFGS